MKPANSAIHSPANLGFSLIEMAMVLMIMGILMSGIMVAVSQTTENARRATALAQLRQIEEALYGFAQIKGYLPCPADGSTSGRANPETSGACTRNSGFVPSATLGFNGLTNDDALLVDPWRNPYRYTLVSLAPRTPSFSNSSTVSSTFASYPATPNLLRVCADVGCTEIVSDQVVAVILSMGKDWAATTSAEETANSGSSTLTGSVSSATYTVRANADRDFVSTEYAEDQFDDQLVWLSPYVLFNKMVSAGQLP